MRFKAKTKPTSLPAEQFSAEQVATRYHERWEIELGLRDIKSSMQGNALTLRSKTADLVYQELWGLWLGYNVVRREASQAAVAHQRAPNEISFKFACQFIASQLVVMAGALSPAHTPRQLEELRHSHQSADCQRYRSFTFVSTCRPCSASSQR